MPLTQQEIGALLAAGFDEQLIKEIQVAKDQTQYHEVDWSAIMAGVLNQGVVGFSSEALLAQVTGV